MILYTLALVMTHFIHISWVPLLLEIGRDLLGIIIHRCGSLLTCRYSWRNLRAFGSYSLVLIGITVLSFEHIRLVIPTIEVTSIQGRFHHIGCLTYFIGAHYFFRKRS